MKKAATATLAAIALTVVMTGCSIGGSETIEQKATADNAKSLEVEVTNADINIYPGKVDKIEAHLYGTTSHADNYHLDATKSGDRAIVRVERKNSFNLGNDSPKLDITVPESEFEKWSVRTSSGDVKLNAPTARDLDIETSSGSFDLTAYNGDKLSVQTSSGDLHLKDINAKNADFRTSSGDLDLNRFSGDLLRLDTSSGTFKGISINGEVKANSSSGDLTLDMKEMSKNLQVKTSSGDVTIGIPSGSNFEMEGQTNSGRLSVDFPITLQTDDKKHKRGFVGNGGPKLTVDTSSGDAVVERH